jgi:hypothetical protein
LTTQTTTKPAAVEIVALSITREMEKINEWPHVDVVFAQTAPLVSKAGG